MKRLPLLCAALLFVACYDSSFGEPELPAPAPATATIGELRALFTGATVTVEGDFIVQGRVTTSDRARNFYRSLCIEQDGAALEVMAGLDHLHNDYPIGTTVTLRLKGLALGESYGVLQVGRTPTPGSGFATDYIGSEAALDAVLTRGSDLLTPVVPTLLTLDDLSPERCGTLVRIEQLHYAPEELAPGTWSGYKRFTDDAGREIHTYVRPYADFAGENVPAGRCSLTGILQLAGSDGRYLLKLRDENDCAP